VVNKAKNVVHDILSIFSPSRVFMEYGKQTMAGFALGITSMADEVTNAMAKTLPGPLPGQAGSSGNVAPAALSANTGPAVVIQNANFNSGLDVQAFMQQAAWVAKTQRV
jgi:hypothetical protein